jgi:hypothetical protein
MSSDNLNLSVVTRAEDELSRSSTSGTTTVKATRHPQPPNNSTSFSRDTVTRKVTTSARIHPNHRGFSSSHDGFDSGAISLAASSTTWPSMPPSTSTNTKDSSSINNLIAIHFKSSFRGNNDILVDPTSIHSFLSRALLPMAAVSSAARFFFSSCFLFVSASKRQSLSKSATSQSVDSTQTIDSQDAHLAGHERL